MNKYFQGLQYVYGFIIFIGLGFMGWYYAQPQIPEKLSQQQLLHSPDAIVTNVTMVKFDKEGHLASRITTPQLQHFPQHISVMQHPVVILFKTKICASTVC